MWALGNYSRFIRPGAIRLGVSAFNSKGKQVSEGDTDPYSLMVSAYRNSDETPVVVVVNYENKAKEFDLVWKGEKVSAWKPYLTSDVPNSNLAPQQVMNCSKKMTIPARSIVTYIGMK